MANEQNLKVPTSEEAREYGRRGGIASGEARREKATMKKTLEMLLNEKNNKGKTYRELTTLGLIKGAVDGKAVELCCAIGDDTIDGKPYNEIVEIAKEYINSIGGFEKFAEWGLF